MIDWSRTVTAADRAAARRDARHAAAAAECRRRIDAVCDPLRREALAGAAIAGLLGAAEMARYRAAVTWIAAMRARRADLAADPAAALAADASWPAVPEGVAALAARF
jgi:hypothetical protein